MKVTMLQRLRPFLPVIEFENLIYGYTMVDRNICNLRNIVTFRGSEP